MGGDDIRRRTFQFACRTAQLCDKLWQAGGIARLAAPQLFRAGTSVGANLEEACAAQTKPDFITKVCISLKEARESHWLRVIDARRLLPNEDITPDIREADEIVAILTTIMKRART